MYDGHKPLPKKPGAKWWKKGLGGLIIVLVIILGLDEGDTGEDEPVRRLLKWTYVGVLFALMFPVALLGIVARGAWIAFATGWTAPEYMAAKQRQQAHDAAQKAFEDALGNMFGATGDQHGLN